MSHRNTCSQFVSPSPYRDDLTSYNINSNKNAQSPSNLVQIQRPHPLLTTGGHFLFTQSSSTSSPMAARPTMTFLAPCSKTTTEKLSFVMAVTSRIWSPNSITSKAWASGSSLSLVPPFQADSELLYFFFLSPQSHSPKFTLPSISPSLSPIGAQLMTGAVPSTIHANGMYIMADFTVGTMSDLIGFEG